MIQHPSKQTLKKYGLTADEWLSILHRQGDVCAICGGVPKSGRFVTDHLHVRNYKKLPDQRRKELVRCITCWRCNYYFLSKGMCFKWSVNLADVLWRFEYGTPTKNHT